MEIKEKRIKNKNHKLNENMSDISLLAVKKQKLK